MVIWMGRGKQCWGAVGRKEYISRMAETEPSAAQGGSSASCLPLPSSESRAGNAQGYQLSAPDHPHGYLRLPSAKGHILGLPAGFNQTKRPVLHLAMAHRDEVVGLWQSPEHGSEGWHQLVAYPGRITKQFQVRQGTSGTRAPSPQPGDAPGREDAQAAREDTQLMPSPSSHQQLIFSLTQAPMCEAELALDDIIFRNCGLQGESHAPWQGSEPRSPGQPAWALHLTACSVRGHLALARAPGGQRKCPLSNPGKAVGRALCTLGSPWGWSLADCVPLLCPRGAGPLLTVPAAGPGQQECREEERRCRQGSCLALHRFCDGTDDCGDGSDEDADQCSEHS